ncbi:MAG: lysylphosphatidylglycerol synthase domain-containing protein [Thermodesulfobacteriota bacterium]
MRRLTLILLAVAVIFLIWMLNEVGWAKLGAQLVQVGWYWPLLLLPYGLVNWLDTLSWDFLLLTRTARPSLSRLFFLRLGGESLNQLTPTASIGGEAFKASRLQARGVPWEEATASVVIHKGILVLSLVLYIFLGLALTPFLLPGAASRLGLLSLAALGLGAVGLIFVLLQRQGPCLLGLRWLEKLGWCPAGLKEKEAELNNLDLKMADFYRHHPGRGLMAFILFFLSWLLHGVEVYLIFWLLGHPLSWGLAISLDALAMLFTALGFFIPAAVGVQDGGNILLALGFHLGAALGAAFSILRRLREAFWLTLGLVVVAREK